MDQTTELDWLDQRLREAAPYINDDGFTRNVVQKLPARGSRLHVMRAIILLGATLVASLTAYLLSDGGRFVTDSLLRMAGMSSLMIIGIAAILGILVMTIGVIAAISKNREILS